MQGDSELLEVRLCDDVPEADEHSVPLAQGDAEGDALDDGECVVESLAVEASPATSSREPRLDVGRCVPSME